MILGTWQVISLVHPMECLCSPGTFQQAHQAGKLLEALGVPVSTSTLSFSPSPWTPQTRPTSVSTLFMEDVRSSTIESKGIQLGCTHLTIFISIAFLGFAVWADSNNNNHPEVTKWTGSAWTRLISGANNLPPVYSTSNIANIAISSNGDVFIAYPNQSYENLVFRLPAGTSTWEQLGVAGDLTPPGLPVYYLSLAVDPKGTPYIMVSDNLDYLFAYSWDGSAWTQLGSASPARGSYFSLALGPNQIPGFAYGDYTTFYPCYMQYY